MTDWFIISGLAVFWVILFALLMCILSSGIPVCEKKCINNEIMMKCEGDNHWRGYDGGRKCIND